MPFQEFLSKTHSCFLKTESPKLCQESRPAESPSAWSSGLGDGYVTTTTWKRIPAAAESSSGIPHVPPGLEPPAPAALPLKGRRVEFPVIKGNLEGWVLRNVRSLARTACGVL